MVQVGRIGPSGRVVQVVGLHFHSIWRCCEKRFLSMLLRREGGRVVLVDGIWACIGINFHSIQRCDEKRFLSMLLRREGGRVVLVGGIGPL